MKTQLHGVDQEFSALLIQTSTHRLENSIDAGSLLFYYRRNTGKEVILKFMSSYHSEVAAA